MTAKALLGSVLCFALTGTAMAGYGRCDERVWVPPQYEIQAQEIVIPAAYDIVQERVWVEPVYEWRYRQVLVPVRRRRPTIHLHAGKLDIHLQLGKRRLRHREKTVREQVMVQPGYWTTVESKVLLRPERVEIVHRKVLVREGYWTTARINCSPREHKVRVRVR